MKTSYKLSDDEIGEIIQESAKLGNQDWEVLDDNGQIIIQTSVFQWNDGSFRLVPDPNWHDEDDF
jgi:hypothetical protein